MLSTCVWADGHRIFPNIPFLFEIPLAGDALGQRLHVGKTHEFKESSAEGERAAGRGAPAPRLHDFLQPQPTLLETSSSPPRKTFTEFCNRKV